MYYGKRLIREAEKIAARSGYTSMAVISAPGTVHYYVKRGYRKQGRYMVKELSFFQQCLFLGECL